MAHIMADLETWGTRPGDALRSIGAVVFDPFGGSLTHEFYVNIDDRSCPDFGLGREPRTEEWWATETSPEARQAFLQDPILPIDEALQRFADWFKSVGGVYIWGHGASFDPVLLEAAMRACGVETPWSFWNVRCCRTILACSGRKPKRNAGTHHNALDDAKAQAIAVAASFRTKFFEPN